MLKISAFAKLSRVSVKALRFYDELGLLKPAVIDEQSGYRYYSGEQLLTVKRIVALKEQGFTLEQIKPFLEKDISPESVKDHLSLKREQLQRAMEEAQQQLNAIDSRLARVEAEAPASSEGYHVTIRSVPPQLAASIRDTIPQNQLCLLLDEVKQYVRSFMDAEANDSLIVMWHDGDRGSKDHADIEVALPIKREIPGSGRVQVGFLPELKLSASLVHHCDPYLQACSGDAVMSTWLASNPAYVPSDIYPIREVYLTPDEHIYGNARRAELIIPLILKA